MSQSPRAYAIDLDGAIGDTRGIWTAWLADAARVLPLDVEALPDDRAGAAAALDKQAGNWRALLERFAEERAPVFLRPRAETSAALRRLEAEGARLGVFTDAPLELAQVALSQLGATRRVSVVVTGSDALARLVAELGDHASVVRTTDELVAAASQG